MPSIHAQVWMDGILLSSYIWRAEERRYWLMYFTANMVTIEGNACCL